MSVVTIPKGQWTLVKATTENTSFQNQSGTSTMYVTTANTSNLPLSDGIQVPPDALVVIGAGKNVSVAFIRSEGSVHYVEV